MYRHYVVNGVKEETLSDYVKWVESMPTGWEMCGMSISGQVGTLTVVWKTVVQKGKVFLEPSWKGYFSR